MGRTKAAREWGAVGWGEVSCPNGSGLSEPTGCLAGESPFLSRVRTGGGTVTGWRSTPVPAVPQGQRSMSELDPAVDVEAEHGTNGCAVLDFVW